MNANNSQDAIDSTIDRALSALRDAQPRSGLESRILTNLEHRAETPQPRSFHLSAHLALWSATAAAIVAVASMMILHHRSLERSTNAVILSEASHRDAQSKDPETARRATSSEPHPTTDVAQISIEPAHQMAPRVVTTSSAMPVSCAQPGCSIHEGDASAVTNGASQTPTDAQLLADLHAPSHPAPPLPLTPEEKLFLYALRYGGLTQIAELNPLLRAKQSADETAAFKAFFPDPPPVQQPNGDTE